MIRRTTAVGALCVLVACHSTPKEHRVEATQKLTAMVDAVTTALADKFPVDAAASPDPPQSCVGTFNNDKGTVQVGYSRSITIPHDTDGSAPVQRARQYLQAHGWKVDKPEQAVDPHIIAVSAGRQGYNLVIDINPPEGVIALNAGTPCVRP